MTDIINFDYFSGNLVDDFINVGIADPNVWRVEAEKTFKQNLENTQNTLKGAEQVMNSVNILPSNILNIAQGQYAHVENERDKLIHNVMALDGRIKYNTNKFIHDNKELAIDTAEDYVTDQTETISNMFGNSMKTISKPVIDVLSIGKDINKNWDNTIGSMEKNIKESVEQATDIVKTGVMVGGALAGLYLLTKK